MSVYSRTFTIKKSDMMVNLQVGINITLNWWQSVPTCISIYTQILYNLTMNRIYSLLVMKDKNND